MNNQPSSPAPNARVMIAKVGLDGHERGAKLVVHYLREAGFDVIYSGIRNSPAEIVKLAADSGVKVLGLSTMSGAHLPLTEEVRRLIDAAHHRIAVVVGGVIPPGDREVLRQLGVAGIVGVGATPEEVVRAISDAAEIAESRGEPSR